MKILLANPLTTVSSSHSYEKYFIRAGSRWPHSGVKRKGTLPHYLPFPFYLAYAAALLRNEGAQVIVADCVALDMHEPQFLELVAKEKPDLLFFETTTPTIVYDCALTQKIKQHSRSTLVVLGGAHATVFAKELLATEPSIDYIVRHEYELSLLNLRRCLEAKADPVKVKGISYRSAGIVTQTENAPLVSLGLLPPPARDLFPAPWAANPAVYWDGFCQKHPAIQMHASRGCPYRCNFCLWNQVMFHNGQYRVFVPSRIVDEMQDAVTRYGAKEIYFDDDDFTINQKHVAEFCQELLARKLNVSWSCMGDAINLTEDTVKLMAQSGCIGIKFGVESGSPRMLASLGKPVNLEKVKQVIEWCARYRIKTHATFSLGLYGDDMESIKETLTFMHSMDSDTIQVSICTPFPGTKFFELAKQDGCLKTQVWEKYDGKASDVVSYPGIDWQAVEKLRHHALRRWFMAKLLSWRWVSKQAYYFFRILAGLGIPFFVKQIVSIYRDEVLTAQWKR